jgi:hypothetical protein
VSAGLEPPVGGLAVCTTQLSLDRSLTLPSVRADLLSDDVLDKDRHVGLNWCVLELLSGLVHQPLDRGRVDDTASPACRPPEPLGQLVK